MRNGLPDQAPVQTVAAYGDHERPRELPWVWLITEPDT